MIAQNDFPSNTHSPKSFHHQQASREQALSALYLRTLDADDDPASDALTIGTSPKSWLGKHVKSGERGIEHRRGLIRDTIYDEAGVPATVSRFINLLIDRKGYDENTAQWFSCPDGLLASATTRTPDQRNRLRRNITNWRNDALTWLENGDNLRLFDYRRVFNQIQKKDTYEYRLLILDLVDKVDGQCSDLTDTTTIRDRARVVAADALALQAGRKKHRKPKRTSTPEAEAKRIVTTLRKLIERQSVATGSNQAVANWLTPLLEGETNEQLRTVLQCCLADENLQLLQANDLLRGSVNLSAPPPLDGDGEQASGKNDFGWDTDLGEETINTSPRSVSVGQPLAMFRSTVTTRTPHSSEKARQAFQNSLSLAEVDACNLKRPKGAGAGWVQYSVCPDCGGSGKHGKFNVNRSTGAYKCHACGVHGKLRESWVNPPTAMPANQPRPLTNQAEIQAKRAAQAEAEIIEKNKKIAAARTIYAKAAPLEQVQAAQDYVTQRTGALAEATAAGVRCWTRGDTTKAALFPLTDPTGAVVAISDRAVIPCPSEEKSRTRGAKSEGVFWTAGAADAAMVAIVEAPLDALVLAASGLPAIALCGTSWPAWLPEILSGRRVLLATDNDAAGDAAASKLATELRGIAWATRLRPMRKDWAEIYEAEGADALGEELARQLEAGDTHDYPC